MAIMTFIECCNDIHCVTSFVVANLISCVSPPPFQIPSIAGIEYETGTQGSQFAPGMERHAPQTLPLQGSAPYQPTMSIQPSYMPGLYGNESASIEMSGSPRAGDTFYPVVTPMTPMEERGRYCPSPALSYQPPSVASVASEASSVPEDTVIEEKVPNEACYGYAVRHADALSDQDEGALLIHGRLQRYPSVLQPEAKIAKPEVQIDKGRSEQVTVTYKLPSYCKWGSVCCAVLLWTVC